MVIYERVITLTKPIINVNDIEKLADNNKSIKTETILQKMVSRIVSLDLPNTDKALSDNGIADRESVLDWLKAKLKNNIDDMYWNYVPTEASELQKIGNSGAQWWLVDAYELVNKLTVPDVEAFADDLGLLSKY